ncbi:MAG: hypothetical protein AVDCRST_MAG22-3510 [uncultured Rubrobacteraceae bacterium]|uniref:TolB protein, periplasmic protein involved in the tonb-independent uptake of group A colicins n=1 Tax=uncultured Rubrobacteraceae bacterium TaxID=349277 RepID=A0A6J4QCF2_9ACTN|nr:MAG: hypothetical protein AVDCRST_MAG22-3510 [uncultured Rubrobacteraceae bacterium]
MTRNNGIDDGHAAWSADGEKVAYVSGDGEGFGSDSLSDLYVMNADGSGKTRLTDSAGFGEAEPTWSSRPGTASPKPRPAADPITSPTGSRSDASRSGPRRVRFA